MWIEFYDMSSGGGHKEDFGVCYIEASTEEEAERVFYAKFGHSPDRVSCTCCGADYSVSEVDSPEEERRLLDWKRDSGIRVIYQHEITDEERNTVVPKQGYVWVD